MKHTGKKIAAVLCAVILAAAVLAPTAYALSSFGDLLGSDFGDLLGEVFNGMGGGNDTAFSLSDLLSNPTGALSQIRERLSNIGVEATDGQILDAMKKLLVGADNTNLSALLNSNDFLNQLAAYLQNGGSTTLPTLEPQITEGEPTEEEEEPTTEEPTTAAPVTLPPTTAYTPVIIAPSTSYVYTGVDPYTTPTNAVTTTEPSFISSTEIPSYTSPVTTVSFTPNYTDEKGGVNEGNNTMKLVIGFALLSASAVAIIVVLLKMKNARA